MGNRGDDVKLSTKGRYGLRAMLDIAVHSQDEVVSINSIAERQGISDNYLEQLIAKLKKADLVTSTRGAQGGYSLAKPMEEITVGDILRALEGDLSPVDCAHINGTDQCNEIDTCVTKIVWKRISDSINNVVDTITLKQLFDDSIEMDCHGTNSSIGC